MATQEEHTGPKNRAPELKFQLRSFKTSPDTFTFHRRRPQSRTQSVNVSVAVPDLGQRLLSPQLHERAQLLQRAAEPGLVVGLATSAMLGPAERVVGHGSFLRDSGWGASPKNLVVGRSCRSSLTGTLRLQEMDGRVDLRGFKQFKREKVATLAARSRCQSAVW